MESREELTQDSERVTGLRIIARNNYTLSNEQHVIVGPMNISSLAEIAIALDRTRDEGIERRGYSGTGGGAVLEVVFDSADPASQDTVGEEIATLEHLVLHGIPLGSAKLLRQFISQQSRDTVWTGQNHIPATCDQSRRLLASMRKGMWTLILTDEQAQFLRSLLEMAAGSQADTPELGSAGQREAELTDELLAMLATGKLN
jgi:hypothetical protein